MEPPSNQTSAHNPGSCLADSWIRGYCATRAWICACCRYTFPTNTFSHSLIVRGHSEELSDGIHCKLAREVAKGVLFAFSVTSNGGATCTVGGVSRHHFWRSLDLSDETHSKHVAENYHELEPNAWKRLWTFYALSKLRRIERLPIEVFMKAVSRKILPND